MRFLNLIFCLMLALPTAFRAQNLGVKVSTPLTALDVFGSMALREGSARTLASGVNNNVSIDSMALYRIIGPTAAFEITGITGGSDGRMLILVNATTFDLTVRHNNASSTAANRIVSGSGADLLLPANGILSLMYNSTIARWLITAAQGGAPARLAIGKATPTYALDVSATSNAMRVEGLAAGAGSDSLMVINSSGVVAMRSGMNVFDDFCSIKFKTATETVSNSTALQDDDHLFFAVNANEKWEIEAVLDVDGASGHIKYAIDIPSGTLLVDCVNLEGTGIGNTPHYILRADNVATGQMDIDGSTNTSTGRMHGIVSIGATGGTVKLRWAQASASGSSTVKINSFLKATRIQ